MNPLLPRRALLAAAALLPVAAGAQTMLPDRTLRILLGFAAGGGADVVARTIASGLQRRSSRSVAVENRPGASGATMGEQLRKVAPDGTTVGFFLSTTLIGQLISPSTFPFDPLTDLTPLGIVGTYETVFAVSPEIGVRTIDEYVRWLKDGPLERRRFGTSAPGTFAQYFAQLLLREYGMGLDAVPYRGSGALAADLAQGRVPAGCGSIASFVAQHRGGSVRVLASSGPVRDPMLPDVPCVSELGFPQLELIDWYAFFGPPDLPPRLVAAWNQALVAVVESNLTAGQLLQLGVAVGMTKPDECAVQLATDFVRWKRLLDMLGIRTSN